ncbi:hypothetical protein BT69DRAFT_1339174 [Atractiella rhizophila]|nr:hypothetical protein BT69DRAFT_1339174 [Atractiella rhizophila]
MPYRSELMSDDQYHIAVYLIGPWLVGGYIEMILFGVLLAQFYAYYKFYADDMIGNKLLVSGLALIQVLKSIHTFATVWIETILFFGDYDGSTSLSYKWASLNLRGIYSDIPQDRGGKEVSH